MSQRERERGDDDNDDNNEEEEEEEEEEVLKCWIRGRDASSSLSLSLSLSLCLSVSLCPNALLFSPRRAQLTNPKFQKSKNEYGLVRTNG